LRIAQVKKIKKQNKKQNNNNKTRPYLKSQLKAKKTGGMTQVVGHLPCKFRILNLIPRTAKIKE
jgi:hypothetical protein